MYGSFIQQALYTVAYKAQLSLVMSGRHSITHSV